MRVLIISQQFPPEKSGNASRIYDLSRNLAKMGLDITVLAPHPNFPPGTYNRKWEICESNIIDDFRLINLISWQPSSSDPNFINRIAYYLTFPIMASLWSFIHHKDYGVF